MDKKIENSEYIPEYKEDTLEDEFFKELEKGKTDYEATL